VLRERRQNHSPKTDKKVEGGYTRLDVRENGPRCQDWDGRNTNKNRKACVEKTLGKKINYSPEGNL